MNDDVLIYELQKLCKFQYKNKDGICTSISFFDPDNIFESTLRHNSDRNKIFNILTKFHKLEELSLRKARINFFPQIESPNLKFLDLSCNNLHECEFLKYYPELQHINIGSNFIKNIPVLSDNVTTLKLHKNIITEHPYIPPKIRFLNLFYNRFENCPQLKNFSELEMFCFGVSPIQNMPDFPDKIKYIIMPCNQIYFLENIQNYKNLEVLQVSKNNIKHLPKEIGVSKIKELYLYRNTIEILPDSFFLLNLKKLNLQDNPICNKEIIKKHFSEIEFFQI